MKLCSTLFLLFIYNLSAQQKPIETIYFDFDKYILSNQQTKVITDFVKNIDTTKIESIQIYGYCDDRGTDEYRLSKDRVNTVLEILALMDLS
nr:OmpA family protein [uncultured Flavobacterium sp.]